MSINDNLCVDVHTLLPNNRPSRFPRAQNQTNGRTIVTFDTIDSHQQPAIHQAAPRFERQQVVDDCIAVGKHTQSNDDGVFLINCIL